MRVPKYEFLLIRQQRLKKEKEGHIKYKSLINALVSSFMYKEVSICFHSSDISRNTDRVCLYKTPKHVNHSLQLSQCWCKIS